MKNIYKSLLLLGAVTCGTGAFTSCSDDESTMSRLFRPVLGEDAFTIGLDANQIPYITIEWDDYSDAEMYVLTLIPTDGSDSVVVETAEATHTFNNLKYDMEYNIKIKATSSKIPESKVYQTSVTTLDFPTMLENVQNADIIDTQARISWDGEVQYDTLKVYEVNSGELAAKVELTETDLLAGEVIVRGLAPKTEYRVEAYQGATYKGKKLFTTSAAEDFGGSVDENGNVIGVVDLRNLTADESYKLLSAAYVDSVAAAHGGSVTFVLQGGVTYRMQTLKLNSAGTIKFVTGLSLAGEAIFAVSGNFDIQADSHIDGIVLDKIFFTDIADKPKTGSNYGGTYLFNFDGAGASIDSIVITNCIIKYKRGVMRMKNSTTVNRFIMDNCVLDSIGGYGIANADNAGAVVKNIRMTNTTVSNAEKTFVGTKGLDEMESVNIENCTFVYCIADSKPFVDYKGKTVPEFNIKNCLFGVAGKNTAEPAPNGISGWSGDAKPACDKCYFASDLMWTMDAATGAPKTPLDGETLSATTGELFVAPLESNFKLSDHEDVKALKNIGDPRWH